jgi:hypothetical protein
MPPETYKVRDGLFTVGAADDVYSQQVREMAVDPSENVETEDDIEVLSGDVIEGEDEVTHDYVLTAKILQDLSAAGFVTWTWTHAGEWQPFTFQPRGDVARAVTGEIRVIPVRIGGLVKSRAESDLTWSARNVAFGAIV